MQVYVIKVTLLGIKPPIWRRFLVDRNITLRQLHSTLQIVMAWTNSHLHQFIVQEQKQADREKLGDVIGAPGTRLLYEYDFGDGWQHELLLDKILNEAESFQRTCVAGPAIVLPRIVAGPTALQNFLMP
jgi:pRiA4b ORF-3-like protein